MKLGDVNTERQIVRQFFAEYETKLVNSGRPERFKVIDWENYSSIGVGRPQELITQQTLERFRDSLALVIGLMGQRFGSPSGTHDSGTEEEFEWAFTNNQQTGWPEVKWFFRSADEVKFPSDRKLARAALDQWDKVCEFRDRLNQGKQIFVGEFKDSADLRECLRKDLSLWLEARERPWTNLGNGSTQKVAKSARTSAAEARPARMNSVSVVSAPNSSQVIRNSIGMELILISSGEFRMGAGDQGASADEQPVHKVRITKPFYLAKYPVTQRQWEAVIETNPSQFMGNPNRPVESVSWHDAQEFLRRLGEKEGKLYRLPTEAEWEYAARAGSSTTYYFGDDVQLLRQYAWHSDNSSFKTHPVGQLEENMWGLHDMHGNVQEWVQDWYAANYYQQSAVIDPQGPEEGQSKVLRGGSWRDVAENVRVTRRSGFGREHKYENIGFRCAQ